MVEEQKPGGVLAGIFSEARDFAPAPVEPVEAGLAVVHKDYRLVDPDPPRGPAHVFSSWLSALGYARRHFTEGFEVFVGPGATRIYATGEKEFYLTVSHWFDDATRAWMNVIGGGNPSVSAKNLSGRALHELLTCGGACLDSMLEAKLRAFALKRVVKAQSDGFTGVSETGTQVVVQGSAGQQVELELPKSIDLFLGISSPIEHPKLLTIPVMPWVDAQGVSFSTHVDISEQLQTELADAARTIFSEPEVPVYRGRAEFAPRKRV